MNNLYEERLGTDRMLPLVFRMALPAVAAQIVNLLYSLVDRIYIGHIPGIGTDALAGIGVTSSVIILISAFSSIVGSGGAPLAAIALGQGDRERAGRILGNGFVLLCLFTVVTSAAAYAFMEPLLLAIGEDNYYVLQGTGLENTLTSGTIQNILDTYMEPDFAAVRRTVEEGSGQLLQLIVRFDGVERRIVVETCSHRQSRITGEGSDFKYPAGTQHPYEHFEKLSLNMPRQHAGMNRLHVGFVIERLQQFGFGFRHPLDVFFKHVHPLSYL